MSKKIVFLLNQNFLPFLTNLAIGLFKPFTIKEQLGDPKNIIQGNLHVLSPPLNAKENLISL